MEQYAERLRALHRDLTLVLQAVERGLATAAHPEKVAPPVPPPEPPEPPEPAERPDPPDPPREPIEIVPEPAGEPAAAAAPPVARRRRMPRVEVMPAPSGENRRWDHEDRREPPVTHERWSQDEGETNGDGDAHAEVEAEPATRERDTPRPASRFPSRPSVAAEATAREPEWVERGDGFTAPTFPPPAPQRLTVSPLVAASFVVAWLVVVALLVALLVS